MVPRFLSDVKARHGGSSDCRLWIAAWPKGWNRMITEVETMAEADSLQLLRFA